MKFALPVLALALALASAPSVQAAPASAEQEATDATWAADADTLAMARKFIAMYYPNAQKDFLEAFRESSMAPLQMIEVDSMRPIVEKEMTRAIAASTPTIKRHVPLVMEAYAQSFAQKFSVAELHELIAFASTVTGRRFLEDTHFADYDERVEQARNAMSEEVGPNFEAVAKIMCKQAAEMRVASGETDAKCSRA
jgi:hypothetical protein